MNKLNYILIFVFLVSALNSVSAQENEAAVPDSLQENDRPTLLILDISQPQGFNFWDEPFKGNWAGIFVSMNGLDQADYSMYTEVDDDFLKPTLWKSNGISINLIQGSVSLQRNRNFIGLVTGLGLDIQTYSLNQNTSIRKGASRIEPIYLAYEDNQKSKFSSTYLTVPALIEFQIPINHFANRLYFSAGVIGSLRLSTHTKVKYRLDGKKQKLKVPGDFYLNDLRVSGTIRVGYRWINLFATYDLQPLFVDGKGPELYPFSIGLALITF
ncbi:outer membrane beta-barrel protein [Mangrovibacterium sp.]|uniref:outer membrane beta-barrel protein n=1 Tax=Mangrovibacterium sp. TaxID=1961364 RepID=UPI003561818C